MVASQRCKISKYLFLKIPRHWAKGPLSWSGLAFMAPEDTRQASNRRKQATVLLSYDTYEPEQQLAWCNNPKSETVGLIPWK